MLGVDYVYLGYLNEENVVRVRLMKDVKIIKFGTILILAMI